jgi:hypothetical protein
MTAQRKLRGRRRATVRSSPLLIVVVLALSACSSVQRWFASDPPEPPTLKTLAGRSATVEKDAGVQATEEQTIAAYRKFLDAAPATKKAPQRAEALRRLGDLEMDSADKQSATSTAAVSPTDPTTPPPWPATATTSRPTPRTPATTACSTKWLAPTSKPASLKRP